MKKTILKALAIVLAAMLCLSIVACNKNNGNEEVTEAPTVATTTISGKYSNVEGFAGLTLEFTADGKVSVEHMSTARIDLVASGTYTIVDNKLATVYTERTTGTSETAEKYSFTDATFEQGEGYIKINGKEYKWIGEASSETATEANT